jgi:hypothetical protein
MARKVTRDTDMPRTICAFQRIATAVTTSWVRPDKRSSIEAASAASSGLPSTMPSTTTSVSAASTGFGSNSRRPMRCQPTAALVRATRLTYSNGASSLRGTSTMSRRRPGASRSNSSSNSTPICRSNSCRRGLFEAR